VTRQDAPRGERGRTADRLALLLWRAARPPSLPLLEALAATAVNRRRHSASRGPGGARVAELADDGYFQLCRRVARRALRGVSRDRTGGAGRCHHRRRNPRWARAAVPCAEIGGYLFYREPAAAADRAAHADEGGMARWNSG